MALSSLRPRYHALVDWSYKLSNERLRNVTKTCPMHDFCYIQQVKYIGHICRLDNSKLQNQMLFDRRMPKTICNKLERIFGMDILQIQRTLMKRNELMRVLGHMFRQERPKATSVPRGKK